MGLVPLLKRPQGALTLCHLRIQGEITHLQPREPLSGDHAGILVSDFQHPEL